MFLSKHPNGRYYIYYDDNNGNRKSKSTGTGNKKDAHNQLIEFQREMDRRSRQIITPIRLKDFAFLYLRHSEPLYTTKTLHTYKTSFRMLQEYFGNIYLSELTSGKIEDYVHYRLRKSSIFAARRDFSNLSAALNKAVRDGYLLSNPCTGIKRLRLPEKQPLFYSKEDFYKLLSVIGDPDIKDLVVFAVNTGLRQMEIITLEWNQIDFEQKILLLDNRNYLTKGKRIRTIPINQNALEVLERRRKLDDSTLIFKLFRQKIDQGWLSRNFKQYVIKAGLHPKLNFHSLRHTFASWLVQRGVSIYVVSKLLGHSDIKTTQIYSHLRSDDLKNAANLLTDG